jgi:alpha-L-fucosidase
MNAMVREIQPWIIFNGRNGLAGDFTTPEGHMSAPNPWRPWEACITLNENWCYVKGDEQWKNPYQVINLLLTAAKGNGNLLLDIGPKPDGSVPAEAEKILLETGAWLERNGEAVFNTEVFNFGLEQRGESRSDWSHLYDYTASGSNLYLTVKFQMPEKIIITGLQTLPRRISMLGSDKEYEFDYNPENGKLIIHGGSEKMPGFRPVFKIECAGAPEIYRCAGMRTPAVAHPPYDPCASDIMN